MNPIHTLIIHHLEECWRDGLAMFGENPEELVQKVIDYLNSPDGKRINNVILTKAFEDGYEPVHNPLIRYLADRKIQLTQHFFPYAQLRESYYGDDSTTLIPSTKPMTGEDDIVCIQKWHEDLATHASVMLCGAFEGECVRDAEDMLDHVRGVAYERIDPLIVGTGSFYRYHVHPGEMLTKADELTEDCNELVNACGEPISKSNQKRAQGMISRAFKNENFAFFCHYHHDLQSVFEGLDADLMPMLEDANARYKTPASRKQVLEENLAFG
jgi:hypothetical protein